MIILKDVIAEMFSMFVADARLTLAIISVIAVAAIVIEFGLPELVGGTVLLIGCVAVLIASVRGAAARIHRIRQTERYPPTP